MIKRNFDFIALLIVLFGFMVIQKVPRVGARVVSAAYHKSMPANPSCALGRVVAKLTEFRSE
jgi:hypothetical protein